jgi:hypothetical protein
MGRPIPSVINARKRPGYDGRRPGDTHSERQPGGHDDRRRSSREAHLRSVGDHVGKSGHPAGHCAAAVEHCSRARASRGHKVSDRARSRRRNRAARCHCTIERSSADDAKPRTRNRHASELSPAKADKRPACGVLINLGRPLRSAWLTAVKGGPLSAAADGEDRSGARTRSRPAGRSLALDLGEPESAVPLEGGQDCGPRQFAWSRRRAARRGPYVVAVDQFDAGRAQCIGVLGPGGLSGWARAGFIGRPQLSAPSYP